MKAGMTLFFGGLILLMSGIFLSAYWAIAGSFMGIFGGMMNGKLFLFPGENREEGRLRVMEFMIFLFVFFIFLAISSVMNVLFKMTEKKHWGMSLLLSLVLAVITIAILGIK